MKEFIAIAIFGVMVSGNVNAQDYSRTKPSKNPEKRMESHLKRMETELELSSSQVEELETIFKEARDQKEAIKSKYPELKEAKAEMQTMKQENREQIKKVLTEEQIEMMKANREKGAQMEELNPREKLEKMKNELNLTETQVEKLKVLFKESRIRREELKEKYPSMEKAKKEFQMVRENSNSRIKDVLSDEQYVKFSEMKKQKGMHKSRKRE